LLGIDPAEVRADSDPQWVWQNAPSSWSVFVMLAVVAALCAAVIYLYRREITTCPPRAKWLLAGLRLAAIALLIGIYLDPSIRLNYKRTLDPSIVVLRDASQSMDLGLDRYREDALAAEVAAAMERTPAEIQAKPPSRAVIVNHLLGRQNQELLRAISERGTVRMLDFAGSVNAVEVKKAAASDDKAPETDSKEKRAKPAYEFSPLTPVGTSTDLRRGLQESLADRLLAAVVVLTDGQHTVRDMAQDDLKNAARQAAERGVPLLICGVGDPTRPRNLAVTSVYLDKEVWQADPFEIKATLRAYNMDEEDVEVSLVERRLGSGGTPDGAETVVDRKTVKIPPGSGVIHVAFKHSVSKPGRMSYTVRAAIRPGESSEQDNEPASAKEVDVLDEKVRLLLIAGNPSWEYQHLMRLLKRENSVNVSGWLQDMDLDREQDGDDNFKIRHLPRTPVELAEYHVIVMIDPNPEDFSDSWWSMMREFVGERAGGLLFMAGPRYSGQFLSHPRTKLFRDMLPIEFGDVARLEVEQLLDSNSRRWQLDVIPSSADEPIMRFYEDASASQARWQQLPGFYWSLASDGAKPGAKVLLERADGALKQPGGARALLVTGRYGGRTAFMGFHGTWRWRRTPETVDVYKRFWLQTVRYLVEGRSLGGKHRVELEIPREEYMPGERIAVTARLKTTDLKPLQLPKVTATLHTPDKADEPVEMTADPNLPGQYAATLVAREHGQYYITLSSPGEIGKTAPQKVEYAVVPPSVELERPWLNKPLLVDLAKLSGGRYFELGEASQIPSSIPDKKQVITVSDKPKLLRDTMRLTLLGALVLLLGTEWAVRKHFKLI